MKRIQKFIIPIVGLCFAVTLLLLTMDFVTKHIFYLQQRDALYDLIADGKEYEQLKNTVAYLQGAATRRLNQIKETSIYFGLAFFVLVFALRTHRKGG